MGNFFNIFVTSSLLFYIKWIYCFEVDILLSYKKVTESLSDRILVFDVVDPFLNCSATTSAIKECVNACFTNEESGS